MTNTPTSYPSDALEEAKALRAENHDLTLRVLEYEEDANIAHEALLIADDQAKALRAENERLRAALTRLVDMVAILPPEYDEPGSAIHQARAALQEGKG